MSSSPPLTLYLPRQKRLTLAGSPKEMKATPTIGGVDANCESCNVSSPGVYLTILLRSAVDKPQPSCYPPKKQKNCARPSHSITKRSASPFLYTPPSPSASSTVSVVS